MKWFPDRRGLATGIALSAFGVGAAIAPAMIHAAMDYFTVAPDFIGPSVSVLQLANLDGVPYQII
ncbi:MAG: sugar phosphate permease [Bacillariaceae sp.]|jgi:sugar phosphate permease